MTKFFKITEYVGFAVLIAAFLLFFSGFRSDHFVLPYMSLLGVMLAAWGIGGQKFK